MTISSPSDLHAGRLHAKIDDRAACVAVIGLGYVGLPLAMAFAGAGYRVIGLDVVAERVQQLSLGRSHILDVPDEVLRTQLAAGRFAATSDYDTLREADALLVSVPTPFDRAKAPDLSFVVAAGDGIAPRLHSGQLVILESTTFPGTTDEVLRPILERSGLVAGRDFFLAFSPERIDPGNREFGIANTPKVVGGIDETSTDLAVHLLQQVVLDGGVHRVSSARAAELTKLLENTYRAVNIALVNELAVLCDRMDIDIWEVIEAAKTKPYGFMRFYPGPGVGGHCIPVDPYYLSWKARQYDFHTKFIELAAETNLAMPFFTVDRVRRLLGDADRPLHGSHILALGASFKKDIDDARNSAAIRVIEILRSEGAKVEYHDPHVPEIKLQSALFADNGKTTTLRSVPLTEDVIQRADCVVILVAHSTVDYDLVVRCASRIFDAVNATRRTRSGPSVERL